MPARESMIPQSVARQAQSRAVRPAAATRITRPNNATGYTAGDVYGDAADARNSVVVPAMPSGVAPQTAAFSTFSIVPVRGAPVGAAAVSFQLLIFTAQPATIIGDNAPLALSDADIALIPPNYLASPGNITGLQFTTAVSAADPNTLSQAAGVAARQTVQSPFTSSTGFADVLVPGATLWFYLMVTAAYAPTALETLDLYWFFNVTATYGLSPAGAFAPYP